MANSEPKLKVVYQADTKDFVKGAKDVKSSLKDMKAVGNDAVDSLGEAFGVNVGKVDQISNAVKGLGIKLSESSNAGVKALGSMMPVVASVGVGIAALGIGAAVTGFKLLNSEAENLATRINGAGEELADLAYINTYKQAFHDANIEIGRSTDEVNDKFEQGWTRAWTKFGSIAKNTISQIYEDGSLGDLFSGIINHPLYSVSQFYYRTGVKVVDNSKQAQQTGVVADDKAKQAAIYAKQLFDLMVKQSQEKVKIAQLDAEIAEYRLKASDSEADINDRLKANEISQQKIKEKYDLQLGTQTQIADLMEKNVNLTNSTFEEIDASNNARMQAKNLEAQKSEQLRATMKLQSKLTKEIEAQNAALQKQLDLAAKIIQASIDTPEINQNLKISDDNPLNSISKLATIKKPASISKEKTSPLKTIIDTSWVTVKVKVDQKSLKDVSEIIENAIETTAMSAGEMLGQLAADLVMGGNAWGDFKDLALSSLAELSVSVGKLAISMGIAALGIDAALKSPASGAIAIAAGVALVALGTAVKAGLAQASSGGDSYAASSIASSNYSSGSSYADVGQKDINVNVTGRLVASGNTLLAVIDSENNRRQKTT